MEPRQLKTFQTGAMIFINSIEALKHRVMERIGVALIPWVAAGQEVKTGCIARLARPERPLETAILMIRHKDKWISPSPGRFHGNGAQDFYGSQGYSAPPRAAAANGPPSIFGTPLKGPPWRL